MTRLRARTFYAVIAAGVVFGAAAAGGAAYVAGARSDGRRVIGDVLVVPVAVMMGGTFGGLAGVAAAVALDRRR
ncbi:MAG: hypothetical protein U0804_07265 [Gemmataceae bacterium]